MNKTNAFMIMLLVGFLALAAGPAMSLETTESVPELDGAHWMQSTSAEKRAFLYGAGSAIVLEYNVRSKHDEQPSKFVQGWVDVFKDQTWAQMERAVDQYYISNPNRINEHVFHAIWFAMIKPNIQ
jgi:hypothetical protein